MTTPVTLLFKPSMGIGARLVDGVIGALFNLDTAVYTSAALQEAQAIALANASGEYNLPPGYFTSSAAVVVTGDGAHWTSLNDGIVYGQFSVVETVGGTTTIYPVK